MRSKVGGLTVAVLVVVLVGVAPGVAAQEGVGEADAPADAVTAPPTAAPTALEVFEEASKQVRALFEAKADSVVYVGSRFGQGSGFYVTDDVVATNYHVIADALPVFVRHRDGSTSAAEVLSVDRAHDLALLRVETVPEGVEPLQFAPEVEPGALALVVGHPYAGRLDEAGDVSTAWSWSLGRVTAVTEDWIQTDATAYPGNSGGPVMDRQGRVVGVVTLGVGGAATLVFAVRARIVRELLEAEPTGYLPSLDMGAGVEYRALFLEEDLDLTGFGVFLRYAVDAFLLELSLIVTDGERLTRGEQWDGVWAGVAAGYRLRLPFLPDLVPVVGAYFGQVEVTGSRLRLDDPDCAVGCAYGFVREEPEGRYSLLGVAELLVQFGGGSLFAGGGVAADVMGDDKRPFVTGRVGVAF